MMNTPTPLHSTRTEPWWRVGSMWLVLGLPATVVVCAVATLFIALARPDVVVEAGAGESGGSVRSADKSRLPAQTGRNHAMTPGKGAETPQDRLRD